MQDSERRKYKRLQVRLDLSCRLVGAPAQQAYTGHTVDVSPGGLYFQTDADVFEPGSLLNVQFSIPPTAGILEFGGKIATLARVLRTHNARKHAEPCGVAVEFCRPPKLCI